MQRSNYSSSFFNIRNFTILIFVSLFFMSQAKRRVVEFTLSNGLRVIFIKKKTSPIIFFSVWYKCGSKDDATSKSGAAHYLEHMAFASNKMEFSSFLEDVGAILNAFTSFNVICFHEIVPKENIETVIDHEARRMSSLDVNEQIFKAEKGAILEERSFRIDNNPSGAAQEVLLANIFNRGIGGIEIIGWEHEIKSLTEEDLQKYHEKYFAPNNAIIIVSGDFNLDAVKELLEEHFGKIPPKQIKKRFDGNTTARIPNICLKEIKYGSPKNGSSSSAEYIYLVPFSSRDNFRKTIALEVAMMALNKPAFFVKKILKDVSNCAVYVAFEYINRTFQHDIVVLSILSSTIDALRDAEDIWHFLKKKIVHVGISKSELDAVKRQYLISLAYKKDDIVEMSNHFGWLLTGGYTLEEIQELDDLVQSITVEECNDLLKEVFLQEPSAISRVEPKGYDRE
jgi:zinc protease